MELTEEKKKKSNKRKTGEKGDSQQNLKKKE